MSLKLAFVGFRHPHIMPLYEAARDNSGVSIVGACEEDADTREKLIAGGWVEVTHSCFSKMLEEVECDAVAVGDYFGRRGYLAIQALKAGKHVIADKPLCTSLEELSQIKELAEQKRLKVGCMFTMRDTATYQTMRRLLNDGLIGEPHSIIITGMHPLNIGSRPQWFFMPGCHGGTIIDIGVHVFDVAAWLSGHAISEIVSARSWNGKAKDYPWFEDCAQFMLKLDNGCGVFADVSYLAPSKLGYSVKQYWRCTIAGDKGIIESQNGDPNVMLVTDGDAEPQMIPAEFTEHEDYLEDFLADINAKEAACHSDTADVLEKHRLALEAQAAATK